MKDSHERAMNRSLRKTGEDSSAGVELLRIPSCQRFDGRQRLAREREVVRVVVGRVRVRHVAQRALAT